MTDGPGQEGGGSGGIDDGFQDGVPFESRMMYTEIILDHYRNPRCFGTLDDCQIHARDTNPSCGDSIEFFARVNRDKVITEVRFTGKGCAISQAAASMLAEAMTGKNLDEVLKMDKQKMLDMIGIPISMMRMKCALLGLKVLKLGVCQHLGKETEEAD